MARALHDLSSRAKGPFVAVECAALSPTLLESELFGHEKGAFTDARERKIGRFEAANGGTLFLDEIAEIDLATQVKLLRVLETRTFQRVGGSEDVKTDIRIVAATNRNLVAEVAAGRFREDLYYRLNVIDIHMPALRERPGDIPMLVTRFLKEFSKENGGLVTGIEPAAMKLLENYAWPGNVRQLRNVVEKMVVLSEGGLLTPADVPAEIRQPRVPQPPAALLLAENAAPPSLPAPQPVAEIPAPECSLADREKEQILATIEACHGNKSKAAQQLGISRRTLHRRLHDWGMT